MRHAPSSRLYSVWTCRCTKDIAVLLLSGGLSQHIAQDARRGHNQQAAVIPRGKLLRQFRRLEILRGQQLLEQIRSENDRLPEPEISEQIDTIESIANQIFKAVIEQPKKAPQIRRFMDYYLPTTLKMLVAFRRMEEGNVTGESADNARQRIRESLDMVIEAFNKQLARLYEDDALDITTDIDVLETMLKQDGLIDSGLRTRTSTGEEK